MAEPRNRLHAFIHHEATAGLILVVAAALALAASNIEAFHSLYDAFLEAEGTIAAGPLSLSKSLHHWINDGLMAVFFFLVGLEIKREFVSGHLSSPSQIMLPAIAAMGGMAAPAAIYAYVNWGDAELLRGWAIPAATDIAFALGALSIAGSRVPVSLKVFLLTLATLDDLGAIVVIALFYTVELSAISLILAAAILAVLLVLNRLHVDRPGPYVLLGILLWICVLKSGVHATLAGVALGLLIPVARKDGSPLVAVLEDALHPYVKFLILPLFAFANAGIPLEGLGLSAIASPLPLGILLGLVVGKPLGILSAVIAASVLRLARLPEGATWGQVAGVACLGGIGFTMSLFIGSLAFQDPARMDLVRLAVIAASVVSAVLGTALVLLSGRR